MTRKPRLTAALTALAVGVASALSAEAANHREAPLTALDTKADITDFFAFVSYDDPSKVTLILNVDPLLEPSNGPNYFPFDPDIVYAVHIDNDHDAVEDVSYEFRFQTEVRLPSVFTGFVGAGGGLSAPENSPEPVPPGTLIVPPAITALDGLGSEGLSLRQHYTVTRVDGAGRRAPRTVLAEGLFAVPSNVGPRTMPDYPELMEQGIHSLSEGVRVFAGTVEDPFWIDLGAAFDSLNFRPSAFPSTVPGVLTDSQDADDETNFAPDDVAGFNVNAIAIEVPITHLTADNEVHTAEHPLATIGTWGTTSRPKIKVLSSRPDGEDRISNRFFVQIQRMANPLFNELIIGTGSKDEFSRSHPSGDAKFAQFALDPVLARVLNAIYGIDIPAPPRLDLLPLVQYGPPISGDETPAGPIADLLRLNTGIGPTPAAERSRLGFLTLLDDDPGNDDPAGFPNGRRPSDDVTDIAARAVAGVLGGFNDFPHNRIGDGVNTNDVPYVEVFPYLGAAHSGRDSRHEDPLEPGCTSTCPQD